MRKAAQSKLRDCIIHNRYEISLHAEKERRQEAVRLQEIEEVTLRGEIIEEYPKDPRGPSCLIFGYSGEKPIHIVCGFLPRGWVRIITVYIPRMPKWINPKRKR